ncbi:MAG: TonB-dependent receptor plug domain-containing protein [Alistipes ihumii]
MMRKFVFCLAVCSVWVTQGVCGSGVEMPALSDDSLTVDMNEVVVTATRTPLPLKNTPVITRVITSRDIERSGAVTLQQALERELAGVEFHQAGYGSSLSFQGLDSRYVLFLLDGERIAGETYGNIDYSRIPLSIVSRIEVVRGASSVLYGSNAMGAVVNVITKGAPP